MEGYAAWVAVDLAESCALDGRKEEPKLRRVLARSMVAELQAEALVKRVVLKAKIGQRTYQYLPLFLSLVPAIFPIAPQQVAWMQHEGAAIDLYRSLLE